MKPIFLACALLAPVTASADAIDLLLEGRCGTYLNMDGRLMNEGAREAYVAMRAMWILLSNEMKEQPPLDKVCTENPSLTARQAMQQAIAQVGN